MWSRGVIEGRRTFANIIKYIKITASYNFVNMFSVLVACASLPVLILTRISISIGTIVPYTNLGKTLGMEPMPAVYF